MKTKYLLIVALGIWTALMSFSIIAPTITTLRDSESSDVAIALLILGDLLAFGGSWRGAVLSISCEPPNPCNSGIASG